MKRVSWIDLIRGIAIVLVMVGHTSVSSTIKEFIYSFHIPLFFYLSGYLFKIKDIPLVSFFKKLLKRMIIPGMLYGWVCYFVEIIFRVSDTKFSYKIFGTFIELRGTEFSIIPWFLITITLVELIFYLLIKYLERKKILIIVMVGLIINYIYIYRRLRKFYLGV